MTPDNGSGSLVGRQIGGYKVLSLVGAGGMGEVYRARDTRLGRDVALKVLQRDRADDPVQQARFVREAQAAGALNHPNILAVFDVGVDQGISFIVSELIDGTSLREKVERAPLPIKALLDLATQIADGLTAAHEANIVHRDLKPENVMVTRDGRAKILDFGLATTPPPPAAAPLDGGTLPATRTETGLVQGTVPYMSPEQARGAAADFRADQFAFGLVLYEMTTGRQAFRRETPVQTLSAIITDEAPSIADLNPRAPAPLRWLIERCLAKDPRQRYAATRDLAQDLRTLRDRLAEATTGTTAALPDATRWRSPVGILLLVVTAVATLVLWSAWSLLRPAELRLYRFPVLPPAGATFAQSSSFMTVSPDGRGLAFIASSPQGDNTLWVYSLESMSARPLPGTDGAAQPFWSADSRSLAFPTVSTERTAKTIEVSTGRVRIVGDALGSGAWNSDDVLLVPSAKRGGALYRVSATGGTVTPVTALDPSRTETGHSWPSFLPDGRHFLYLARSRQPEYDSVLCVGSLDSTKPTRLFQVDSQAVYVPPGYLIFMQSNTLFAQPFDADRLSVKGERILIAEHVERTTGAAQRGAFSVSQAGGVLAYRQIGETQLTWFNRDGRPGGSIGSPALYGNPALSPNETSVAVSRLDPALGTADIWLFDVARGVPTRFTFDPSEDSMPLWSKDGSRLIFRSNRRPPPSQPTGPAFYAKASSGAGPEEFLLAGVTPYGSPFGWTQDGSLLYEAWGQTTGTDLLSVPLVGDRTPAPILRTESNERQGRVSPDGRRIAYVSNEYLQNEVYVRSFPSLGEKTLISTNGGIEPQWRQDGTELFYLAPQDRNLMAVAMKAGPRIDPGRPTVLFPTRMSPLLNPGYTRNQYVVSKDGQSFLINQAPIGASPPPISVVLNWTALLKH